MAAGQYGVADLRSDRPMPCLLVPNDEAAAALTRMAAQRGLSWARVQVGGAGALREAFAACEPGGVLAAWLDAVTNGPALLDDIAGVTRAGSPIVLLHDGIDAVPGCVIPADRVRAALFEASGAISAGSARDLLDLAFLLAALRGLWVGHRVAILTGGGGGGVIAADLCAQSGLQVPPLSDATRAALVPLVPAIASTGNPVDLTPEMFTERFYDRFGAALDTVASDPAVDAVLLPTTFNAPRGNVVAAQVLAAFARRCPKPVLVAADPAQDMRGVFAEEGTAVLPDVSHAARALAKLMRRAAWQPQGASSAPTSPAALDLGTLETAGFFLASHPPTTPAGAVQAARRIGFPLVVSQPSQGRHAADIWDESELAEAVGRLQAQDGADALMTLRRDLPGLLTLRILATRDPTFGPVVAIGAGGLQGRILDRLAIMRAPFDAAAAAAMLSGHPVIAHARKMLGTLDLGPAAAALALLSAMAAAEVARFDLVLDPVEILPDGLRVLDATLSRSER